MSDLTSEIEISAIDWDEATSKRVEALIFEIIALIGDHPARQGLLNTPKRVRETLEFLTSGYRVDPSTVVGDAIFEEAAGRLVVVRNIEFYSQCEHHILPFFGKVHIGYVPDGKVIGLSKIPRLVDVYARRLQIQERLTEQIADALVTLLSPQGVAVVVDASHMCMRMRGVEKQSSTTHTSTFRGLLNVNIDRRAEFFDLFSPS
jgi:GTP cyclohydrolase I